MEDSIGVRITRGDVFPEVTGDTVHVPTVSHVVTEDGCWYTGYCSCGWHSRGRPPGRFMVRQMWNIHIDEMTAKFGAVFTGGSHLT